MFHRLCILLLAVVSLSAAPLQFGKWSVETSPATPFRLSYGGRVIYKEITCCFFAPHYKKQLMALNNAKPEVDGQTITWKKSGPHGDMVMTLTLDGQTARYHMAVKIKAEGPVEYGYYLDDKSLKTPDGNTFVQADGNFVTTESQPFQDCGLATFTCDLFAERHQFANIDKRRSFMLQDRRGRGEGAIRIISVAHPKPGEELTWDTSWTVTEFDADVAAQRSYIFKEPVQRVRNLEFPNPGFEDGADAWNKLPKNAAIDTAVSHSGKASVRLTVKDPMVDAVYVTRKIPVVGSAFYEGSVFVKTDNVQPAPGKMSTVGAGLIVEWSDHNGKWIAAGTYACDEFGTSDWKKKICRGLRAPEGAGYAEIFLAVRAAGTAWFDDLVLTETKLSVNKLSPQPTAKMANNTPNFTWKTLKGMSEYTVSLSQKSDFPAGETLDYKVVNASSLQLEKPLKPGLWYWRVTAQGADDVQPWTFTQTAPVDRDCMPPEIQFRARRILNAGTPVLIKVRDTLKEEPKLSVRYGDTEVPVRLSSHDGNGIFEFSALPAGGWPKGFTTLKLTSSDRAGNRAERDGWLLNLPKPANSVIINAKGRYEVAGKPVFPYGIYEVKKPADMLELRELGFDAVHTYEWESSRDDAGCLRYLDDCWAANGLRAFIGFDRRAICNAEFDVVAKRVGAIAGHPALFVYYLFDEPEIPAQYVSPKLLTEFADLIRELDPFHAVVMTTWNSTMINYRRTWDTHWTQSYTTPDKIVAQIDQHKKFLKYDSPITLLIHCYDQKQRQKYRMTGKIDLNAYEPDYEWMRCAAFAGICQDINGLWWWWYAKYSKEWLTAASIPEIWVQYCKVIRELRSYQKFLEVEDMAYGRFEVDKQNIVWGVKKTADQELLIVANTGVNPVKVSVPAETGHPQELELPRYGVALKVYDLKK